MLALNLSVAREKQSSLLLIERVEMILFIMGEQLKSNQYKYGFYDKNVQKHKRLRHSEIKVLYDISVFLVTS